MSFKDIQLKDNEIFDNSITKRDFLKIYHQQAANLNDFDQIIEIMVGEIINYHQVGNAYLQYEMKIEKNVANAADRFRVDADAIGLVNNAFAYCFKEARLSTTSGSEIEHKKYCGQVSTIMRALTNKDGDLISHFDKIIETQAKINNTSLHHHINNNHDVAANKRKNKGHLSLEHIFGFCKTFKKITKQFGFHLTFKTADLQDIIYTIPGDDIKVSFDELFLFVPIIIPIAQKKYCSMILLKVVSLHYLILGLPREKRFILNWNIKLI